MDLRDIGILLMRAARVGLFVLGAFTGAILTALLIWWLKGEFRGE